jgi:hypothetical protein
MSTKEAGTDRDGIAAWERLAENIHVDEIQYALCSLDAIMSEIKSETIKHDLREAHRRIGRLVVFKRPSIPN